MIGKRSSRFTLLLLWGLVLFVSVLGADRLLYGALYPVFDQRSTLSGMFHPSGGIVVGSSQTRWGIDGEILSQKTGIDFQIFAPPGANIGLRRAIIEDYLQRFAANPPRVLILETHPYLFHRRRYPEDAYRTLLGYRPKGLMPEYLARGFGDEHVYLASHVFHVLSFNEEFYATGAGLVDLALVPLKSLRPAPPAAAPELTDAELARRIEGWALFHNSQKLEPMFDFGMQAEFSALMKDLEARDIRVILLEIPLYELVPGFNARFDSVRKRMLALKPARFEYVRLDPARFETNPRLFHDASHLGDKGRPLYSEALARYINGSR